MSKTAAQVVGSKIRQRRDALGISQERFARLAGTSRRNIMRWEGGHHMPSFTKLAAVARALGCEVSDLLPSPSDEDDEEDPVADLMRAIRRVVREEVGRV